MASNVLPVPARPSSAITLISGSINKSSAKRCSLLRERSPHASGAVCASNFNSLSLQRASADCEPLRNTAKLLSTKCDAPATSLTSIPPLRYSESICEFVVSNVVQPIGRESAPAPTGWCSSAINPMCAALMRNAASFEIMRVGEIRAWPSAAPIIRLSGTSGSRPCSTSKLRCTPLTSICTVPLSGPS